MSGNLLVERGTFYSGHRTALGFSRGRVKLTTRLSIEPSYSTNRVDLREGSFMTHLLGSRVTRTFTPLMFVSALLQYNSTSNAVTGGALAGTPAAARAGATSRVRLNPDHRSARTGQTGVRERSTGS